MEQALPRKSGGQSIEGSLPLRGDPNKNDVNKTTYARFRTLPIRALTSGTNFDYPTRRAAMPTPLKWGK